ncbi:disulfide bond formation protein DsbB family [Rickettsiella grylli]|uniref:Disulfide bond formation protein DsbB family n=1 Tax=Rickettsiella grylli TaxID=59196 RepID=A8PL82_9COXI|nr:disulfide bond formation protein B [Rickettsiella grylli]EDP46715.1 disulfide bond formation protein DsbB family [Rickettsiella grylli]
MVQTTKACDRPLYRLSVIHNVCILSSCDHPIISAILGITMMHSSKVVKIIKVLNALDAIGLAFLLFVAFVLQLRFHELPCPLCLLQRIGILGIAFGFLLNVQFKIRPVHYALSLLSAMLTAAISTRQIFLHVAPGDQGYGLPLFGLHLYTWVFILCVAIIIYISIIFSIFPQYQYEEPPKTKTMKLLKHATFAAVFVLAIFNGIATYLECGIKVCPENPVHYEIKFVASSIKST